MCVCVCVCERERERERARACVCAHACMHAHLPSQRLRICMMIIHIMWDVNTLSLKCQFDMA